ncbi:MAG: hypothetical protein ACPGRZ_05705 [Alphaproteobacteria bacterium]
MNKDLERQVEMEKREKAAEAKRRAEMRNAGASSAEKDLSRRIASEKKRKKAERNASEAFKKS